MKSQPLQTAFTSMTLALVIFLSIWLIQATQAELNDKARVPLQVKAGTAGADNRRSDSRPDPFADPEAQYDRLAEADLNRSSAREEPPSVEMQGVRVRKVSGPELSNQPDGSSPPAQTLELPQINIYAGGANTVPSENASAEYQRMKAALDSESSARKALQSKIDAITREQAKLNSALERKQSDLSLSQQEQESLAEKLEASESKLSRLNSTTQELRSEAAEMKNSLKRVTNEFNSLRTRFEDLQKKPRELAALPLPQAQSQPATPPPAPKISPRKQDEFVPPIIKDGKSGVPLAPPSDSNQTPLIEADPLFDESEVMDCDYPPMMACGTCTETEDAPARGLLPMLYRKLKQSDDDCCRVDSAEKRSPARCTEAGTCESESDRREGIFYRLCDYVKKKTTKPYRSQHHCPANCSCGCQDHSSRGLIPNIARWIEARQENGCFEDCCCDSY